MGKKFLMDTNAVIGYLGNKLPEKGATFLDSLPACISVITRIELLGWHNAPKKELDLLTTFIEDANVFSLDEPIIAETIRLRQLHKIKTPDAIIAATALVYNFTLLTRNTNDFKNIANIKLVNPWKL